jgi:hypothetical protein
MTPETAVTAYERAKKKDYIGSHFDGGVTRAAVERVLGSYRPDSQLSAQLLSWGEALLGSSIFRGIDRAKWQFVSTGGLPPAMVGSSTVETMVGGPEKLQNEVTTLGGQESGTAFPPRFPIEEEVKKMTRKKRKTVPENETPRERFIRSPNHAQMLFLTRSGCSAT